MLHFLQLLSSIAFTSIVATAKPVGSSKYDYLVKEVHNPSQKWSKVGAAPNHAVLNLSIGLKMAKWEELERHIYEVSDPAHARYGKHLSSDEVNNLMKPDEAGLSAVQAWLGSHGYIKDDIRYSPSKDWVKITIPVRDAERLLQTKYHVYRHDDGTELIRTPEWSLPEHLHQHVMTIQPTNSFMRAAPRAVAHKPMLDVQQASDDSAMLSIGRQTADSPTQINEALAAQPLAQVCRPEGITVTCLRNLYKTINYTPQALDRNSVAFVNYLNETSMDSDLQIYLQDNRRDAVGAKIEFKLINGGADFQNPTLEQQVEQLNAEGNLDGQTLVGMVHPMKVRAYNTGGKPPFIRDSATPINTNEPYLDWVEWMLANEKDLPQVISTSYGDNEQTVPRSYAEQVCKTFGALGARGVTLLFASGDTGVGLDGTCHTNTAEATPQFMPSFPDGCPFVTSVGGTKGFAPEVAVSNPLNSYASGGGFSNYFARPAYQDQAVAAYKTTLGQTHAGLYNGSGRAFPDIAGQGQSFLISWNGRKRLLDGTSASTPAIAGVLALYNDFLISSGRPPLGFMNPWLYSVGFGAFTDVLGGSSAGCGTTGFPAAPGWDPVTGFGTPDFIKLQGLAPTLSAAPPNSSAIPPNSTDSSTQSPPSSTASLEPFPLPPADQLPPP